MNIRTRSYGYALATLALALVVGWSGRVTWLELGQLHRSFASAQTGDFHLSEYLEASIGDLNRSALRFGLRRNPADRREFERKSQEVRQWISRRQNTPLMPETRKLMDRINLVFEGYQAGITRLMQEPAQAGTAAGSQPSLEQVESQSAPLLELCRQLKSAERTAQAQFMKNSRRALAWLQELLIVLLALLAVLAGTAAVAIYRGVIGPLRVELGESRARAARNEKLASLGTLAAGVAHEIRNPLTAINVRLHGLKKNLTPRSSEFEDASVIGHEIQRLERILQEFLQFARPAEPKLLAISVDSLFARVQSLFGPKLEKTAIRLNVESVPDVWMRADPYQIEQVLINLVQNAAESLGHDGTITLRARTRLGRVAGRSGPWAVLEVNDTGRGIPPEVQQRMFDPFFTTKEEGTGLGLPIAARIVEKHGGLLECRSELNRGATFTIVLPQARPDEDHEPSP